MNGTVILNQDFSVYFFFLCVTASILVLRKVIIIQKKIKNKFQAISDCSKFISYLFLLVIKLLSDTANIKNKFIHCELEHIIKLISGEAAFVIVLCSFLILIFLLMLKIMKFRHHSIFNFKNYPLLGRISKNNLRFTNPLDIIIQR